jgi:DNA processing protein
VKNKETGGSQGEAAYWGALTKRSGSAADLFKRAQSAGGARKAWEKWHAHAPLEARTALDQGQYDCRAVSELGGDTWSRDNPAYPTPLQYLYDPPPLLHFKGNRAAFDGPIVAIVGTRRCTDDAARWAFRLGHMMAHLGVTVISGLASGIDIAAQRGVLESGGATIACLAHGLDHIYPRGHAREAEAMQERGGLLTEFAVGAQIQRWHFAARNRVVIGCADVTVVVQSPEKGGAMISAELALENNRELLVLRPPVKSGKPLGKWAGNAQLLRDAPHSRVSDPEDVAGWFRQNAPRLAEALTNAGSEHQRPGEPSGSTLVDCLGGSAGRGVPEICAASGRQEETVRAALFRLEMEGRVRRLPGGRYVYVPPWHREYG